MFKRLAANLHTNLSHSKVSPVFGERSEVSAVRVQHKGGAKRILLLAFAEVVGRHHSFHGAGSEKRHFGQVLTPLDRTR